jgi:hypothetical protein
MQALDPVGPQSISNAREGGERSESDPTSCWLPATYLIKELELLYKRQLVIVQSLVQVDGIHDSET